MMGGASPPNIYHPKQDTENIARLLQKDGDTLRESLEMMNLHLDEEAKKHEDLAECA
jgi:hypothetical protein